MRRFRILLVAALVVAVAVWSGYRAERRTRDAAGAPAASVQRMVKRLVTPAAKRAGTDRLEELRQAIGRKYPSRGEITALWSVVRGFSAEEVKAALDSLPKEATCQVNEEIASMLYFRWAQLDPVAAGAAALADKDGDSYRILGAILAGWAPRDSEAAIRWGRESGSRTASNLVRQLAARQWVADDPATALARARAEFPESESSVIRLLISKLSNNPGSRQQLFAILTEEVPEKHLRQYLSSLAYSSGRLDSAGLEAITGEMVAAGLPEDLTREFSEKSRLYFPSDGVPDSLSQADVNISEEARHRSYQDWVANQPEEALHWTETRGESALISKAVTRFADDLLQSNRSLGRETQTPWAGSVRKQFAVWQRMDAAAANAWLATMPTDFRNLVDTAATPTSDATR